MWTTARNIDENTDDINTLSSRAHIWELTKLSILFAQLLESWRRLALLFMKFTVVGNIQISVMVFLILVKGWLIFLFFNIWNAYCSILINLLIGYDIYIKPVFVIFKLAFGIFTASLPVDFPPIFLWDPLNLRHFLNKLFICLRFIMEWNENYFLILLHLFTDCKEFLWI